MKLTKDQIEELSEAAIRIIPQELQSQALISGSFALTEIKYLIMAIAGSFGIKFSTSNDSDKPQKKTVKGSTWQKL